MSYGNQPASGGGGSTFTVGSGAPTGATPLTPPFYYDDTNNQFYAYNGTAWEAETDRTVGSGAPTGATPTNPPFYWDDVANKLYLWNGTAWEDATGSSGGASAGTFYTHNQSGSASGSNRSNSLSTNITHTAPINFIELYITIRYVGDNNNSVAGGNYILTYDYATNTFKGVRQDPGQGNSYGGYTPPFEYISGTSISNTDGSYGANSYCDCSFSISQVNSTTFNFNAGGYIYSNSGGTWLQRAVMKVF